MYIGLIPSITQCHPKEKRSCPFGYVSKEDNSDLYDSYGFRCYSGDVHYQKKRVYDHGLSSKFLFQKDFLCIELNLNENTLNYFSERKKDSFQRQKICQIENVKIQPNGLLEFDAFFFFFFFVKNQSKQNQ